MFEEAKTIISSLSVHMLKERNISLSLRVAVIIREKAQLTSFGTFNGSFVRRVIDNDFLVFLSPSDF